MARALTLDINTNDAQTRQALARLRKELGQLDGSIDKTSKRGIGFGQAMGGLALGAGAAFAVSEFEEAEQSARSTEAVIRSTGNAAEVSAEQQAKLVDELSRLAGVDDDVVNAGANMLRTFTQIKGENFGLALAAAMDLAAFKGQDLATVAEQIGKALNDPVAGMGKLAKQGVVLSDVQKQQVRDFAAVGDIASAQGVILKELETEYGGQAEAAATSSGRMKVALGEAAESVGAVLAPAMEVGADAAGVLASAFGQLPVPAQAATIGILGVAYAGPKVVDGLSRVGPALSSVGDFLGMIPQRGAGAASAMTKVSTAVASSPTAMTAGALGVGALTAALLDMALASDKAKENADSLVSAAESTGKSIDELFNERLAKTIAGAEGGFDVGSSADVFGDALDRMGVSTSELSDALRGSDAEFKSFKAQLEATARAGGPDAMAVWVTLRDDLDDLRGSGEKATSQQKKLNEAQRDLKVGTEQATAATEDNATATERAASADETWYGVNKRQVDKMAERRDRQIEINEATEKAISLANEQAGGELAVAAAHDAVQDAQMELGRAVNDGDAEDRQRAADDLTAALIAESEAVVKLAEKNAELEGRQLSAGEKAEIQRVHLRNLQKQTGFTSSTLDGLIRNLEEAAWERKVNLNTAEAERNLDRLINKLNDSIEGFGKLISIAGVDIIGSSVSGAIETATRGAGGGGNLRSGPVPAGSLRGEGTMIVHNMNVTPSSREVEAHRRKMDRQNGRKIKVGRR